MWAAWECRCGTPSIGRGRRERKRAASLFVPERGGIPGRILWGMALEGG